MNQANQPEPTKHVERLVLYRCVGGFRLRIPHDFDAHPLLLELFEGDPSNLEEKLPAPVQHAVGVLMARARAHGLLIEPKGRHSDPVLHLSRIECLELQEGVLQPFAEFQTRYAAQWGLTDFYDRHRAALQAALESGQPFDTGNFGAHKEIQYGRVKRSLANGPILVNVRCESDDGVALADTAFWRAAGGNSTCESGEAALRQRGIHKDDLLRELEDLASLANIGETNEATAQRELPADVSFDDLVAAIDELVDQCDAVLEARYEGMVQLANARLAELKPRR